MCLIQQYFWLWFSLSTLNHLLTTAVSTVVGVDREWGTRFHWPRMCHFLELCAVPLRYLNVSHNRLTRLPLELRHLEGCLEELHVEENPLQTPPIALCYRGQRHVCKLLAVEAARQGFLSSGVSSSGAGGGGGFLARSAVVQRAAAAVSIAQNVHGIRGPLPLRLGAPLDSGYSTAGSSSETVAQGSLWCALTFYSLELMFCWYNGLW